MHCSFFAHVLMSNTSALVCICLSKIIIITQRQVDTQTHRQESFVHICMETTTCKQPNSDTTITVKIDSL